MLPQQNTVKLHTQTHTPHKHNIPHFSTRSVSYTHLDVYKRQLDPETKSVKLAVATPNLDRQTQFSLLLEAYWQTKNFKVSRFGFVC